MVDVPYIAQQSIYDCGAAVVGMVTKYYGIYTDHNVLVEKLLVDKDKPFSHTPKRRLRKVFSELDMVTVEFALVGPEEEKEHFHVLSTRHLDCVITMLDADFPVILNYKKAGQGHYGVAYGYNNDGDNNKELIVHCPEDGPDIKIPFSYFEKHWQSANRLWEKWFMVVLSRNSNP